MSAITFNITLVGTQSRPFVFPSKHIWSHPCHAILSGIHHIFLHCFLSLFLDLFIFLPQSKKWHLMLPLVLSNLAFILPATLSKPFPRVKITHSYSWGQTSSRCWKSGQAETPVVAVKCSCGSEASGARATRGPSSSWWFSSLFPLTWLLSSCSSEWLTVWKHRN